MIIIQDTRPIQKLTKREVDHDDDMKDVPETKVRRTVKQRSTKLEENSGANTFNDPPIYLTRLFDGKEICVINGDDELPKKRIEEILLQHRAKIVQNPLKGTYCIIVGNVKTVNMLFFFVIINILLMKLK